MILGNTISIDIVGMGAGHIYWFLEDVFPNQPNGRRLLKTPLFLRRMVDEPEDDETEVMPEDRPGGFAWGAANNNANNNNNVNDAQQN